MPTIAPNGFPKYKVVLSLPPSLFLSFHPSSAPNPLLLFQSSTHRYHTICRTMPKTRSDFDTSQLLHDDDCDIMNEYSIVVDGAMDMRRKFSLIVSWARQVEAYYGRKKLRSAVSPFYNKMNSHTIDNLPRLQERSCGGKVAIYSDPGGQTRNFIASMRSRLITWKLCGRI